VQVTHAAGYTHPCEFDTSDVVVTGDNSARKSLEEIYGYKKTKVDPKN